MEFQAVDQSRHRILGSDISNSPVIPTSNTPTPMQIFTQPAPTTTATITPSKIASETAVILDFIKPIMEAMIPKDASKSFTILPSSSSSSNSAFLPLKKSEIEDLVQAALIQRGIIKSSISMLDSTLEDSSLSLLHRSSHYKDVTISSTKKEEIQEIIQSSLTERKGIFFYIL